MRFYAWTFLLVFVVGLIYAWSWGEDHRLSYLSKDYAFLVGKNNLIDHCVDTRLAIFGDSAVMDGVEPKRLGQGVINCAMNGSTPIESYFLFKRLLKHSRPQAIILSYSPYHFVHPDFYWEYSVKFGLVGGSDADEVMEWIVRLQDKELLSGSGFLNIEQRVHSFLLSRGFPPYYISSFLAQKYGVREKENKEALNIIAESQGQYFFPLSNGSKKLNSDTQLKEFKISPVIDHYFKGILSLARERGVPVYFFGMPVNESSVPYLDAGVIHAYESYLSELSIEDLNFHILPGLEKVYSWKLFSDQVHLNIKGADRFNSEFSKTLSRANVPGSPYENTGKKD
jgi:hypothetical protein